MNPISPIQRFTNRVSPDAQGNLHDHLEGPCEDGDWVDYADHERVAASLCRKLAESEAKVKELEAKLANWKANAEHVQGNFQRETLRTSEQYQMLVKWMKRNADKGCSSEPWAKDDCLDCTLMRETKELLERPINVTCQEARKKGAEHA